MQGKTNNNNYKNHISYVSEIHNSHTKHTVLDIFNVRRNDAPLKYSGKKSNNNLHFMNLAYL